MATRRYHKKNRASRKGRKVGRKSRRVMKMKGGGLRPNKDGSARINLKDIPPDKDEGFRFLNDYIRTKTGFDVYLIKTLVDVPLMIWTPIAGEGLRRASYVKNQLAKGFSLGFKGRTPLEEFKQNIKDIYQQDLLTNFNTLDVTATVILKPDGIKIGEVFYPTSLTPDDFKENVVNFYRNLSD